MQPLKATLFILLAALLVPAVLAQEKAPTMTAEQFLESLNHRSGRVTLPGDIAELDLPDSLRYLSPEDTERVLVDAWGNPPGSRTLGMIVPADRMVLDEGSWAVVVSYDEDGHVSDDDAAAMDFDELLLDMKSDTAASSVQRVDQGYGSVELVGWAEPPHYDAASHKLYWAQELKFEGSPSNTLNYAVRILGRKGVLVLNTVAGMPQLDEIRNLTPGILAMTNFTDGNRYTDFDPDLDQVAAYGIGGLIAGKLAMKAGLFAKLGVLLLALKKFWILIAVAVGAVFMRLFKGKSAG